jgi:hypothetical protein
VVEQQHRFDAVEHGREPDAHGPHELAVRQFVYWPSLIVVFVDGSDDHDAEHELGLFDVRQRFGDGFGERLRVVWDLWFHVHRLNHAWLFGVRQRFHPELYRFEHLVRLFDLGQRFGEQHALEQQQQQRLAAVVLDGFVRHDGVSRRDGIRCGGLEQLGLLDVQQHRLHTGHRQLDDEQQHALEQQQQRLAAVDLEWFIRRDGFRFGRRHGLRVRGLQHVGLLDVRLHGQHRQHRLDHAVDDGRDAVTHGSRQHLGCAQRSHQQQRTVGHVGQLLWYEQHDLERLERPGLLELREQHDAEHEQHDPEQQLEQPGLLEHVG